VSEYYQKLDVPHFDYRLWEIPELGKIRFRGPRPELSRPFVACIGAAQTFGRFVTEPFSDQLSRRLESSCVNLGLGGIGPRFWLQENVVAFLRRARLVVVQIMAGRSASNSLFDNSDAGNLKGRVIATGQIKRFESFLDDLVQQGDRRLLERVVAETRQDYAATMLRLAEALRGVPTVLLWISRRKPAYRPDWSSAPGILREFPQLIDQGVVDRIRPAFGAYVECTSEVGIPQRLWRSDKALDGAELEPDGWLYNRYYPSPEMHSIAADLLAPRCAELLLADRP
jgi:hypothetical protein